jgi:hypothetical protein
MSWLVKDPKLLKGTEYFEFYPGPFEGNFWSRGSAFLAERVFGEIEHVFRYNHQGYDRDACTYITAREWEPILADLEQLADDVLTKPNKSKVRSGLLSLPNDAGRGIDQKAQKMRETILDLVRWIRTKLRSQDAICILGL